MNRLGGVIGQGWLNWLAGHVVAGVLFLSAAASMAWADSAMTQQEYLQSIAKVCGTSLPAPVAGGDLIAWARAKGMNPTAGWNLSAKLTKEVMAQTLVQLLNLTPPGSGNSDALWVLERQGIAIPTRGGYVTHQNFRRVIEGGIASCANRGGGHDDHDDHDGHGGRGDDDDDDDDGHGRPTGTKPGNGHGDDNHDHSGPPGKGGKDKGRD